MGKEIVQLCYHCGNKTLMKLVSEYSIRIDYEGYYEQKDWELYLCPVCKEATLNLTKNEWFDWETPELVNLEPKTVYPPISQETDQMPINVKNAFEAAIKVRNMDDAICALALRRTLEMMCKDKGEMNGDLYKKLENLSARNILPPILTEMATILRRLGNAAAHADEADFPTEVVSSMIDFTQTILDYVYVLPGKLSIIQKKLSKEVNVADTVVINIDDQAKVTKDS